MDKYLGKRLDGRYELQELIGVGGMSTVYKAYDSIDDRTVAIKILKEELLANEEFRRRFKNEFKAIAVLSHPNIVKVYDVSFGDLIQYIVMEYIDGITLKEYIEQQKVIRWQEAVHFTVQILRGIQHAHDKGIVHRDIKPQNIMLLSDGTIKVADFGIARFSRSDYRTVTDKALGSVHYISPEQARGDVTDEKADIYSLGVMIYEMLTGRLPFEADTAVSVAIMQMQNDPKPLREINESIPVGLEQITLHAMQKDPKTRYQSAAEMLKDIEEFKANPQTAFDYKYFVDDSPTKYVPNLMGDDFARNISADGNAESDDDVEEEEGKSPVVPILAGITAAFIIVLAILAALFWDNLFGETGPEYVCPDLIGMSFNEAVNKYSDYDIRQDNTQYSPEYEVGEICAQTPTGGIKLKGEKTIKVTVSLGPKSVVLDDLSELSVNTAITKLTNDAIKYTREEIYSDTVANGYIVRTDPIAGSKVSEGDTIILFVSIGAAPKYVKVPNLKGITLENAKLKIEGAGLKFGGVEYETSSTMPQGYVISQSEAADTTINKGTSINLKVSNGKPVVDVVFDLPLPVQDASFVVTIWYENQLIYTSNTISTAGQIEGAAKTTITLASGLIVPYVAQPTVTVRIGSDTNYADYKLDFTTGKATLLKNYDYGNSEEFTPTENNINNVQ